MVLGLVPGDEQNTPECLQEPTHPSESCPPRVTSFLWAVSFSLFSFLPLTYRFCAKVHFLFIKPNFSGIVTVFKFLIGYGRSVKQGWVVQGKSLTEALDGESHFSEPEVVLQFGFCVPRELSQVQWS